MSTLITKNLKWYDIRFKKHDYVSDRSGDKYIVVRILPHGITRLGTKNTTITWETWTDRLKLNYKETIKDIL